MTPEKRYLELRSIMVQVADLDERLFSTRIPPYPTLNGLIWYEMRTEGYTLSEIGRAAGRDHTTVMYGAKNASEIIETRNISWRSVITVWDEFEKIVKEKDEERETVSFEYKRQVEKDRLISRIVALPEEDRMDIILAVKDSMSITEFEERWEVSTTQNESP